MKICRSLQGIISQNTENIDMNQWMNQKTAKQTISKRRNRMVLMVCRTIAAHKFRARLRFNTSFEGENMQHSIA